jgi:hypothetical protein
MTCPPCNHNCNERLTAATDDAKEAEAYAEQLEAKLTKAVETLRYISTEVSIPVKTKKHGGIKFKWMYFSWREVAVKRIDIARSVLAELEGGE